MSGQRIYYVPPRLVGSIRDWSGMDRQDGESWLIGHAADMGFNAIWFSPFCETTSAEKDSHGKKVSGSYYATRDHFMVDPEFSSGGHAHYSGITEKEKRRVAEMDKEHLQHFCMKAAEKGMRVYADLVFNHVAADHPLVSEEKKAIDDIIARTGGKYALVRGHKNKVIGISYGDTGEKNVFHFKFRRNDDLSLLIGGPKDDPWADVAQVNYSSPEGRRFFVEGDANTKGYFKQVIDWHLERGFKGFRCDAAYTVPPESWQELISYAHQKLPDVIFLAETLGHRPDKVNRLAKARITGKNGEDRPAFDLGMLGTYWWNYEAEWLPREEHPRVQKMAKYGGAGSPDNHDTELTLAAAFRKASRSSKEIAKICVRDYAISALACNSVFMQMGFEYGNEKQNSVFKHAISPQDWEKLRSNPAFDISDRIRAINSLKQDMQVENCRVHFKECAKLEENLVKIHVEYIDVDTSLKKAELVLLVNQKPETGAISPAASVLKALEDAGLEAQGDPAKVEDIVICHGPLKDAKAVRPAMNGGARIFRL